MCFFLLSMDIAHLLAFSYKHPSFTTYCVSCEFRRVWMVSMCESSLMQTYTMALKRFIVYVMQFSYISCFNIPIKQGTKLSTRSILQRIADVKLVLFSCDFQDLSNDTCVIPYKVVMVTVFCWNGLKYLLEYVLIECTDYTADQWSCKDQLEVTFLSGIFYGSSGSFREC